MVYVKWDDDDACAFHVVAEKKTFLDQFMYIHKSINNLNNFYRAVCLNSKFVCTYGDTLLKKVCKHETEVIS